MSKSKSVWETLSAVNVNDHTEKKNGLTYLSWAWAWGALKKQYPSSTFEKHIQPNGMPYISDANGYAYVQVSVTVEGEVATEVFPVLDYRNKAIQNPDAFAINTAMQRALAKAISYHGLGHYIYAGEDLPQDAPESAPKPRQSAPEKKPAPSPAKKGEYVSPSIISANGEETLTSGWNFVGGTFIELLKVHADKDTLRQFWVRNKGVLTQLQEESAQQYEDVLVAFKKRNAELEGETA